MASIPLPCSFAGYRVVKTQEWRRSPCSLVTNNHKASSFSYTISNDIPLVELPGASFDQYMEDNGRAIRAIIPERATSQHLIQQEEWRIKMPPVQLVFQTIQPVVDLRMSCKSNGEDYPPHVPQDIPRLYESKTTKWELQGLHADYMPTLLNLKATGTLYVHRKGSHSCIKHHMKIHISVAFPPSLLALVPQHSLHNVLDSIVRKSLDDIQKGCATRLLADYTSFKQSKYSI